MPAKPELVAVKATWYSSINARKAHIDIKAASNANVFRDLGAILVPDDFHIPIVQANRENVRYYGLSLIENEQTFEFLSD